MGNNICRVIAGVNVSAESMERFAALLRQEFKQPAILYQRDLRGRSVRDKRLVAARDANLRLLDIDAEITAELLARTALASMGDGNFLIRIADDEGSDVTYPAVDVLAHLYPGANLGWVLEADERPIPWNTKPFFLCPGNPPNWNSGVPVMAALLHVAQPGMQRLCPICRFVYCSNGKRGQCPSCGFVAYPFCGSGEAKQFAAVRLDAFAWGRCPPVSQTARVYASG